MATIQISADWESAPGTPLVAPANAPTIRIRRIDTQALVVTDDAMTEAGDGVFFYNFTPPVEGITYSVRADGDPTAVLQVPANARYRYGQADDFGKETWQNQGNDPANPKTINENTPGEDYDESVDALQKSVIKSGGVTTITRT